MKKKPGRPGKRGNGKAMGFFEVKAYTTKALCSLYSCNYRLFMNMIKPLQPAIGKKTGYYYNPRQVRIIVESLGIPFSLP